MSVLPPCPRCGARLSWSCHGRYGEARCKAGQSRHGDRTPRDLLCQFYAEVERMGASDVRFRYEVEVAQREALRATVLAELRQMLAPRLRGAPPLDRTEDMTPNVTDRPTPLDIAALLAQLEDGLPYRDAPLTYEQARAILHEAARLQRAVNDRDQRIAHLLAVLS